MELQNLAERLLISNPVGPWDACDLEGVLLRAGPAEVAGAMPPPSLRDSRGCFEEHERAEITSTLSRHRWNVSAAARTLGVSRGALRSRMARLGLS